MQVNLIWQWDAGGRYWRDWVRARKWSSREAAYRRTGAIYFAVSEEMDAAMRKLETLAANAESYAFEKVMKEFPTLDKSWDDKLAIKWFEDLRAQFTEQKIPDGSPTFVAVDRAFTHTVWACKDRRRRFLAPELRRDRIPLFPLFSLRIRLALSRCVWGFYSWKEKRGANVRLFFSSFYLLYGRNTLVTQEPFF